MITGYKVVQADGNRALAKEVTRFLGDGWEPHGSVSVVMAILSTGEKCATGGLWQAMVQRAPESAELARLREIERLIGQIDGEIDATLGTLSAAHTLDYVRELLVKALRRA